MASGPGPDLSVIYRYPFRETLQVIPAGDVLHVAAQYPYDELPTLWVRHTVDQTREENLPARVSYLIVGTGHPYPADLQHVGSAVCANGALVWHVFRVD